MFDKVWLAWLRLVFNFLRLCFKSTCSHPSIHKLYIITQRLIFLIYTELSNFKYKSLPFTRQINNKPFTTNRSDVRRCQTVQVLFVSQLVPAQLQESSQQDLNRINKQEERTAGNVGPFWGLNLLRHERLNGPSIVYTGRLCPPPQPLFLPEPPSLSKRLSYRPMLTCFVFAQVRWK